MVSGFSKNQSMNTTTTTNKTSHMKSDIEHPTIEKPITGTILISDPQPANGSTNVPLQPTCGITLTHTNGTGMTLTWYENSTGSWLVRQINGSTNWYNAAWNYRKLITIDHTKISTTLRNFPVLINLPMDQDLATKAQDNGDDICFVSYADNTTKLNHEIEWFNRTTGKLSTWVNTTLSSTTDTKLWMYYGNNNCENQQNTPHVWDASYGGVWHMQEIDAIDSTSNNNTGANIGTPLIAPGIVNNSVDFIPTDSISLGTDSSIDHANDDTLTWECWIKGDSAAADQVFLVQSQGSNSWNLALGTYDTDIPTNAIKWITRDDDGLTRDTLSSGISITPGSWMHIVGTYQNGPLDNKSLFINGVLTASTTQGINNLRDGPTTATYIGHGGDFGPYDGKIDEVRISKTVRNASWINTTYQTIAHPSSFFSIQAEQSLLTNGTYQWTYTQANTNTTTYYWKVAVTDTYQTVTRTYHFTTAPEPNQPPYPPSDPSPTNGAVDVSIHADLSWSGGDPDGDPVTYTVFFGTSSSPSPVAHNISQTTYDPGTLSYNTLYYWRIVAYDNQGASTTGLVWHFTTGEQPNQPPYIPTNPEPANGSTEVSINILLSWIGGDPDPDDTVTYDVYFGTVTPPPKLIANQTNQHYNPGTLTYDTTYYWKIVSWDTHDASTSGPLWHFRTKLHTNRPPYAPSNPSPANGSTQVPIDVTLKWNGGDPDSGDTVTYDVYFSTSLPLIKIQSNLSGTSYTPTNLSYGTKYYWQIIAWDNHHDSNASPLWWFNTKPDTTPPSLQITSPKKGYISINLGDIFIRKILIFITTMVIGKTDITATVTDTQSGVKRVEFYIDNELKATFTAPPYKWTWTEQGFVFPYTLKVIAYDYSENQISSELKVWKIL